MRWVLGADEKAGYWFLTNQQIASNLSCKNIGESTII